MLERLPEQVFIRPVLAEAPQVLAQRPDRATIITTYNAVFGRLMVHRTTLLTRFASGEFNGLGAISEKIRNRQPLSPNETQLMRDYTTLLNAQQAYFGRRNLNTADEVEVITQRESQGGVLTSQERIQRERYQAGRFHEIPSSLVARPLRAALTRDRYEIPVTDHGVDFAVADGAPVEGMINLIDAEITQLRTRWGVADRDRLLAQRRRARDVLFTQSTQIFSDPKTPVFHARNQYESYMHSIDALRREWILPDWLRAETVLQERRVLNVPQERGSRRWIGGLPFVILLPIPICLGLNTILNQSPCRGTDGDLSSPGFEVFDAGTEKASVKGAIDRELGYLEMDKPQTFFMRADNIALIEAVDRVRNNRPEVYQAYHEYAAKDYQRTAQNIRGDQDESPWVGATDFDTRDILASCSTPEHRMKKAEKVVERKNNPQWWYGVADAVGALRRFFK